MNTRIEVRRSRRGTVSAVVNLALAWVTALVVIGNQLVRADRSTAWLVVGVILLLWSAVIFSGLLRPVKLVADERGLRLVKLFGHHRFGWDELTAAEFARSEKFAVIAAKVEGRERFAAFPKRGVDAAALDRALALIYARRPDLAPSAAAPKTETETETETETRGGPQPAPQTSLPEGDRRDGL